MRWTKAAPFPEPEEELYGTVINGKFYVVGGFGFNPLAGQPGAAAPAGGRIAAGCTAPGGGCPPGLIYEYDPGPDKWTKKRSFPSRCTTRRKRRSTGSSISSVAA